MQITVNRKVEPARPRLMDLKVGDLFMLYDSDNVFMKVDGYKVELIIFITGVHAGLRAFVGPNTYVQPLIQTKPFELEIP